MRALLVCACFASVLQFNVAGVSGNVFTNEQENEIKAVINAALLCKNIPGMSVAVVKGSEEWTMGFGVSDIQTETPVTENTTFMTGSLGKSFTMTLMGMLLNEHGMSWDTKLADIRGVNVRFYSEELTREATLADLLSHRTGLSPVTDYGFIGQYPDNTTVKELSQRAQFIPKHGEFRSMFLYNNMMYVLAAHVSEVLGGYSWNDLVTSRLFEPLGMVSTSIIESKDDVYKANVARPYMFVNDEMQNSTYGLYDMPALQAAGLAFSNAKDMARWIKFNLQHGVTESGKQLLPRQMLEDAFQTQQEIPRYLVYRLDTPTFPVNDSTTGYGYAWFISTYRGKRRVWHSGGLFSYVSLIWLYPDQDIGIYASINGPAVPGGASDALTAIFLYLSDLLLGENPWINSSTVCTYPAPWRHSTGFTMPKPPTYTFTNLKDFVGTYGNYLFPDIDISLSEDSDGKEMLRLSMNTIKGNLLPQNESDTFKFEMTEPWEYAIERIIDGNITITYPVTFNRSNTDVVESFVLSISPANLFFAKNISFSDYEPMVPITGNTSRLYQVSFVLLLQVMVTLLLRG